MKLIIDTNIFYSAIGFDNAIYDFVCKVFANYECKIYCSEVVFDELKTKLYSKKFDQKTKNNLSIKQKQEFLSLLNENLIFVKVNYRVIICRDPDDNMFLELAQEVNADYIISGDKDLLEIKSYKNTKILKPSQFMALDFL